MAEKELIKWVLIIAFIGGGIILVRWIIKKVKEKIMDQSEPEPVDEEDVIISDMVSSNPEQTKGETIPIYKFDNVVEAMAIKAMLEENNVPCVVTSFEDLAYDGMFQVQKGWGMLQVFEGDKEKTEELITAYLEGIYQNPKPVTEPSENKPVKDLLFKIVTAILIGALLSGFVSAIVWLIRSIFR